MKIEYESSPALRMLEGRQKVRSEQILLTVSSYDPLHGRFPAWQWKVGQSGCLGGKISPSLEGNNCCQKSQREREREMQAAFSHISCFFGFCSCQKAEVAYYKGPQLHNYKSPRFQPLNTSIIVFPHPSALSCEWIVCCLQFSECYLLFPTEMETSPRLKTKVNITTFSLPPSPRCWPFFLSFFLHSHCAHVALQVFVLSWTRCESPSLIMSQAFRPSFMPSHFPLSSPFSLSGFHIICLKGRVYTQ